MDLLGEASSESRILSARHIGADKTLPDTNDAINTTILCHTYSLQPDFQTNLAGLQPFAWVVWSYGLLVLLTACVLYVVSIRSALRNWKEHISHVAVILAVYPIVTASGFITLLVPRSRLIAEAVAQQAVMVAMYHKYCLIIAECNGTERLIRRAEGSRLETRVLPCCCWPCCVIPKPLLSKKIFTWLKFLILQMPVIQAILYIILLVLFAEDMSLYLTGFSYVQPFIVISIMLGVWGMIMSVRVAESAGRRPRKRFLALQLALIIVKLQYALGKVLPEMFDLPCILALHPTVFVHMLQNIIMMFEMLLLSTWACCLYSRSTEKVTTNTPQVVIAVLEDMPGSDDRTIAGVENRSFENRI